MAEYLGISASIAGLVSLADITFKYVYKYVRAARDAKTDVQSLAEEVNDLASVLRTLEALASGLEAEEDNYDPTLRNHHLGHCRTTLTRIEIRAKKAAEKLAKSKRESVVQQLKWPFTTSETKGLLDDLSRHKATINAALAADTMRKLQLSLTKADELGTQIAAIGETLRKIEINTVIDVNDRKQLILDYFMRTSPQPNLETSTRLRHPLTGLWLTESSNFRCWLETPGSKLWLTGIPGAGKTVLAGSVVQEALTRTYASSNTSAAFFFCDYKDPKTWNSVNILGAVSSQLARQKDEAFEILRQYYDELHPSRGLAKTPDPDELRAKIGQMSELFEQTIIVVDGLDECGDNTDDVVDILMEVAEYSDRVSMALFSRDHLNIRTRLGEDFEVIPIAARTEDVRIYVGAELERRIQRRQLRLNDTSMKEEIMETLVSRAKGMFRWVVCQLDYLCNCAHDEERRDALRKLPPDLPESYRRLLERVNRCSHSVQRMVKMCLQFIAFSNITILQLRQAISTPEVIGATLNSKNTISEDEISGRCSSLIRKSEDGRRFEFAHFSVREFLEDEASLSPAGQHDLQKYFISESASKSLIGGQCLRFIQLKNFDMSLGNQDEREIFAEDMDERYPFYDWATTKWLEYFKDAFLDSEALDAAKVLFHPSKKPQFQRWAIRCLTFFVFGGDSSDDMKPYNPALKKVLDVNFRPLHMAAALNLPEICTFLLGREIPVHLRPDTTMLIGLAIGSVWVIPGLDDDEATSTKEQKLHDELISDDEWSLSRAMAGSACRLQDRLDKNIDWVPSNYRRNFTIDCLIRLGVKIPCRPIFAGGLSTFSIACVAGATLIDFSSVIKLLSYNVVPGEAELQCLKYSLYKFLWEDILDPDDEDAESPTLAILHHLDAVSAYTHEWARQLGSIVWEYALAEDLLYTGDLTLVDSGISMSEEVLNSMICSAISKDDVEVLTCCIDDDRLDKAASYSGEGDTLLHLATRAGALEAFEALLTVGCDPCLENKQGCLPIHLCRWDEVCDFLHVLKDFGVSASCSNTQGYTICHTWARDNGKGFEWDYEFLSQVFELDAEATTQALQMKTASGDTPLALILKRRPACPSLEQMILCLLEVCSMIPDFWRNHDPVLGAAVAFGSEKVIQQLQESGVGFEAPVSGARTPLHLLPAKTSMRNVRWLLEAYTGSVEQRIAGELPVEAYIMTSLRHHRPPQVEIIEALVPPKLPSNHKDDEKTLWGFICAIPGQFLNSQDFALANWRNFMREVFDTVLQLGAVRVFEEQTNECGLIPFFSGILEVEWESCWTHSVFTDTVRDLLVQTRYWAAARQSPVVVRFLKIAAVCDLHLGMARLLLEHGVDVQSRSDGESIVELACNGDRAVRVCATAEGKAITQSILDHSEVLNTITSLDEERRGLLHSLATGENATDILWLAEALIQRGVDVNSLTRCPLEMSALVYHVRKSSSQFAQVLLKLGADPLAGGHSGSPTAVQAAIETENVDFLKMLLSHKIETSSDMDWGKSMDFKFEIGNRSLHLRQANVLHRAALNDKEDCLNFFLGENLVEIEASKSAELWTPLHVSSWKGSVEITKILLSNGADGMAKTNRGETPVHIAAMGSHLAIVKLLIESGASESFDALGKMPTQYARERNFGDIVEYLDGVPKCPTEQVNFAERTPPNKQQLGLLAEALEDAVQSNNQLECERLITAMECPVDIPLLKSACCSALVLALDLRRLELAECLLGHGASSLKSRMLPGGRCTSVIEIAAARPHLNPLLPKLLRSYCTQGGDLVHGDDFPLHAALWAKNIEGLEILIRLLEECVDMFSDQYQLASNQALKKVLNRRHSKDFGNHLAGGMTALHLASQIGSKSSVSLLVEKGADIDGTDSYGVTPLMCAWSADMAEHLVKLGASMAAICRLGPLPFIVQWFPVELFTEIHPELVARLPRELINSSHTWFPTLSGPLVFTTEKLMAMLEFTCDLTHEDEGGKSVMHHIICDDNSSNFVLNNECGLLRTTPFPWHLEWSHLRDIAFLGSRFKDFRGKLPYDAFCQILNLEPSRGWSPLCRAAAYDHVDIMRNCLEMGAQVDFEGCSLGSAIMYASACGSLDAVKLLVRHGASLTYFGRDGFKSCVLLAGTKEVKSWLLCGRFTELLSIEDKGRSREGLEAKPWSGFVKACVRLYGKREKAPIGSTLDNAKRLWKARKYWEGKIVPVDDEIVELFAEELSW